MFAISHFKEMHGIQSKHRCSIDYVVCPTCIQICQISSPAKDARVRGFVK